jgi:Cd2+/Zn2+-exporting ATPase
VSESCCHDACQPAPVRQRTWVDRMSSWQVWVAGACIALGFIAGAAGSQAASVVLYAAAIATGAVVPAARAAASIRLRELDINVLMVIAAAGASILGDLMEAATVLWLFSVAQWLERLSMDRARRAMSSLLALAPSEALVRRDGVEQLVEVDAVGLAEIVIVRPGERIPLDGVVIRGLSEVNQAPVTGESAAVHKRAGDDVFAGTINGTGALEIEVLHQAANSTIAQIARLVEQARLRRAPIQSFVDRFARRYTPIVIGLAVLVAVVPPLVLSGAGAAFSVWFYRALTLVVVACPCALVISTPVSIVSALTAAARSGVLVKGGAFLERLAAIRCLAFDKTGTLTHDELTVTQVFGVDGASEHGVLTVAASLESRSEHPIGRAIVSRALYHGLAVAPGEDSRALPGLGAEARVAELPAIVGSHRLFEERQLCTPALHDQIDRVTGDGGTAVLVGHAGSALGVIGLADQMRSGTREAIDQLRRIGVNRIVLLSGDSQPKVAAAMSAVGFDEAHAELMPADKADLVAALRAKYGPVAMVGDGINDAPALAAADIGIAMGMAGTDAAIETADVALMSDDLSKLPYALRLGRATMANIQMNIAVALGLKLAFVVLAASGLATLWMAVLADTGASLLVTANGLRLLKFRA